MSMACCSVLSGGGTNQELVLHCLHESGGNLLVSIVTCSHFSILLTFFLKGFGKSILKNRFTVSQVLNNSQVLE